MTQCLGNNTVHYMFACLAMHINVYESKKRDAVLRVNCLAVN